MYNGIRKKEINFTKIFPIAKITVFDNNSLYFEFNSLTPFIRDIDSI